ncbi:hypothetical protein ACOSQ4_003053 [Xanthoceras sorbifolium]
MTVNLSGSEGAGGVTPNAEEGSLLDRPGETETLLGTDCVNEVMEISVNNEESVPGPSSTQVLPRVCTTTGAVLKGKNRENFTVPINVEPVICDTPDGHPSVVPGGKEEGSVVNSNSVCISSHNIESEGADPTVVSSPRKRSWKRLARDNHVRTSIETVHLGKRPIIFEADEIGQSMKRVAESQSTSRLNQTDLEVAMNDMRAESYHGFVILLKILERFPNSLQGSNVTFLMPADEKLSAPELSLHHLQNFVFTHTIPSLLVFNNMLHFPNGTLVPSGMPGKMLSITHNHGLFFNNARIVNANVCVNSRIKCHGISSAIAFNNLNNLNARPPSPPPPPPPPPPPQATTANNPPPPPPQATAANNPPPPQATAANNPPPPPQATAANNPQAPDAMDSQKTRNRAKPSPSIHLKRNSPLS